MVQQTQLRLLFKYIEENMDTAVSSYDAKQIKKILGGILLDEPVIKPEPEQTALNPIADAYERGEKIRHKNWLNGDWIQKHKETKTIDNHGNINSVYPFAFIQYPEKWEIYTEPTDKKIDPTDENWNKWQLTKQPTKPFDKERFEAMFRAVVASGEKLDFEYCKRETTYFIQQLDAYYASKEGGENE